jgi:hypothetical protein
MPSGSTVSTHGISEVFELRKGRLGRDHQCAMNALATRNHSRKIRLFDRLFRNCFAPAAGTPSRTDAELLGHRLTGSVHWLVEQPRQESTSGDSL